MDAADALPPPRLHRRETALAAPFRAVRVAAWRGRHDVALIVPQPGTTPRAEDVLDAVELATRRGARQVVTGALAPAELHPFLATGFTVHERLHLLDHDLHDLEPVPAHAARLRRAWRHDHEPALTVDGRAFDPFWRLDHDGLEDALRATAATRFRVAAEAAVVGYAVTGRSGRRGYLQRLAVDPGYRRQGLGRALVLDGLHWLRRRHVDGAVVNTQVGNEAALRLYRAVGFVLQPDGLTVLTRPAGPPA